MNSDTIDKILIIEDDRVMYSSLQGLLEAEGYEVVLAKDGITALKIIRDQLPDLILMDVMIPKLSGFELLDNYQDLLFPGIPVIIMSSLTGNHLKDYAEKIGAAGYYVKPFSGTALLTTIRSSVA